MRYCDLMRIKKKVRMEEQHLIIYELEFRSNVGGREDDDGDEIILDELVDFVKSIACRR